MILCLIKRLNSENFRALLFDLPSQEDLARLHKIKIIKYPLRLLNIDFNPNTPKDTYFMQGLYGVEIGVAPYRTQFLANNGQAKI